MPVTIDSGIYFVDDFKKSRFIGPFGVPTFLMEVTKNFHTREGELSEYQPETSKTFC